MYYLNQFDYRYCSHHWTLLDLVTVLVETWHLLKVELVIVYPEGIETGVYLQILK